MRNSDNYNMELPEYNDYADINVLTKIFKTIDKGIVIDVGDSAGDNNDYVLDIGNITLTALNRGVGFRFWANRDSDATNLVKIVVDINKYNLLDMYGKNIKNIKKGTPYTVIWNGDGNFFLGSGGNTIDFSSTTVGTDGKYVLEPHTFINQNGDLDIGTMPNRGTYKQTLGLNGTIDLPYGYYDSIKITQNLATHGAITDAVSQGVNNNYLYTRIPMGAYFTKSGEGYPEIRSKISDICNVLKTLPPKKQEDILNNLGAVKQRSTTITGTKTYREYKFRLIDGFSNRKLCYINYGKIYTLNLDTQELIEHSVGNSSNINTMWNSDYLYFKDDKLIREEYIYDLTGNQVGRKGESNEYKWQLGLTGQEYRFQNGFTTLKVDNNSYKLPTKIEKPIVNSLWGDWIFYIDSYSAGKNLYAYNYKNGAEILIDGANDQISAKFAYDKINDAILIMNISTGDSYKRYKLSRFYADGSIVVISNGSTETVLPHTLCTNDVSAENIIYRAGYYSIEKNSDFISLAEGSSIKVEGNVVRASNKIISFNSTGSSGKITITTINN